MLKNGPHPKIHLIRPLVKSYPLYMDKQLLTKKYLEERLSTAEIAQQLSTARSTILKYLKLHDIPLRNTPVRWAAGRGLAYGKRIVHRQEVAFKREQENIARMHELRKQGFSYWKIADAFNTLSVSTKTGRGKWHARSIQQIMDANKGASSQEN